MGNSFTRDKNLLSLPSELLQVVADVLGWNIDFLVNLFALEVNVPVNWTALPTELLQQVADKLKPNIVDYIRFRRVCTSWRSSTADVLRDGNYPPQPPWLIFGFENDTNKLYFLRPYDRREHSITLPQLHDKIISVSYQGWLAMEDHNSFQIFLFNPITRKRLFFPSVSNLPNMEDINREGNNNLLSYIGAIAADSTPNSTSCTYVVFFQMVRTLAAFRAGENSWTIIDTNYELDYREVVYFEQKFFAATYGNEVLVIDSNNLRRVGTIQCPVPILDFQLLRFFELSGKLVVMHTKHREYQSGVAVSSLTGLPLRSFIRDKVEMLELYYEGPTKYEWRKRSSIGDQILFVGCSPAFLFPADRFPVRGQEDTVYISETSLLNPTYVMDFRPGIYSFKNGNNWKLPWKTKLLEQDYCTVTSQWHSPLYH